MNSAIISWLRKEGHDVIILLTGMRLTAPMERYNLAPVAGPHVYNTGGYVVATPLATGRMFLRRLFRRLPPALTSKLRHSRTGLDAVLGKFPDLTENHWFTQTLEKLNPEALFIDTIFRVPLLTNARLARSKRIIITHDVFHRRADALKEVGYNVLPSGLTRHKETQLLAHAAHIVAIQTEEAELLREMCPQANVITAPMPARPCPPAVDVKRLSGRLVFVGSDSPPNLDGLRWFFDEIWPDLRGHSLTLDLIGDCGPALRLLPPNVNVLGRISNLAPLLHQATLAISPLRVGSGLKIKLLDYARHGLFTVATAPSLQGFVCDAEAPFILADNAGIFADAILKHAASPQPPHVALAYISRHYSEEKAFTGLKSALRAINRR